MKSFAEQTHDATGDLARPPSSTEYRQPTILGDEDNSNLLGSSGRRRGPRAAVNAERCLDGAAPAVVKRPGRFNPSADHHTPYASRKRQQSEP